MERNSIAIGKRIRSIREELGMTTEEFAECFTPPASKGTVSKWENGHYMPNNKRLVKIAELKDITVNELLYGDPKSYLDDLLSNSKLLNDFSTIVFDNFYKDLENSASSEEDLYLSEEEAAKRYKRFSEQMKLDDHVDDLGSSIHLAYENRSDPNLVQMHLNDAHNEYSLLFGKSPEDANNDIKRKKKE